MPVWVVRGGEDNRWVDAFVDGAVLGFVLPELDDGRGLDRYQAVRTLELSERHPDPTATYNRFHMFVATMEVGDPVLLPDPNRKEVVVGLVDGAYAFDAAARFPHHRAMRWVGRHGREALPGAWVDTVWKQRPVIGRHDAASLNAHVAAVLAGELGRPARERGRAATTRARSTSSSSPGRTRAPARPKAPVRVLRTCPSCGFNLSETVFDGQDLCRDCRA